MKSALRRVIAISITATGLSGGLIYAQLGNTNTITTTNATVIDQAGAASPTVKTNLPRTFSGYTADRLEWVTARDFPKGATMAILEGAPNRAGAYTVRYHFPPGYRVPLGWLSADQRLTVLSGVLNIGLSPTYDVNNSKAIGTGSFAVIPANMRFAAWTDEDTIVQVHGIGPAEIHYLNP